MSARIARIYFVAILAAYAVVLCLPSYPLMLDDYPDWVYQGVLLARTMQHQASTIYVLKHYPVPNSLTTVGLGLLTLVFGWKLAAKLWLLCVFAVFLGGCLRLEQRLKIAGSPALFLLPTVVLLGWDFWLGHISFLLGEALLFWMIAHLLDERRQDWKTALFLVLIFFAHLLPCVAAIVVLFLLSRQERNLRILAAIPALLLVVWYAIARDRGEDIVDTSLLHLVPAFLVCGYLLLPEGAQFLRKRSSLVLGMNAVGLVLAVSVSRGRLLLWVFWAKLYEYVDGFGIVSISSPDGSDTFLLPHALQTHAVAWLGIALSAIVACLLLSTLHKYLKSTSSHRFLALASMVFLVGFVLLPNNALGVAGVDGRALTLGLSLMFFLSGMASRRLLGCTAALSILICLLNLFQMGALQNRAVPQYAQWNRSHLPIGIARTHPMRRVHFYELLDQGIYQGSIFPTGLFYSNHLPY